MIKSFALASVLAICGLAAQPMLNSSVSVLDTAAYAQAKKKNAKKGKNYQTSSERYQQNMTSRDRGYYSGGRLGR